MTPRSLSQYFTISFSMSLFFFFFFNDTATTEIYTLSLHDALPIFVPEEECRDTCGHGRPEIVYCMHGFPGRSEEHTSELQSHSDLVCRLLLEKKKNQFQLRGPLLSSAAADAREDYPLTLHPERTSC